MLCYKIALILIFPSYYVNQNLLISTKYLQNEHRNLLYNKVLKRNKCCFEIQTKKAYYHIRIK